MKNRTPLAIIAVLLVVAIAAAACAPAATPTPVPPTAVPPAPTKAPTPPAATSPAPVTAAIVLPDGTKCDFAGRGATLSFDGKRLNYTCGANDVGLIGDVRKAGTGLAVEKVTLTRKDNAWAIGKSETITMEIATIELTDGSKCDNAGKGATLSFDGKRLNYTCGSNELGLIGDLQIREYVVSVERARIARESNAWVLKEATLVPIHLLRAAK